MKCQYHKVLGKDNVQMNVEELGLGGMFWIYLVQDRERNSLL
jgi:hypothetical protein